MATTRALPHAPGRGWRGGSGCRRWCSFPRRSCGRPGNGACAGRAGNGGSSGPASSGPLRSSRRRRVRFRHGRGAGHAYRRRRSAHRDHADRHRPRRVPVGARPRTRRRAARPRRPLRGRVDRELPPVPRARAGGRRTRAGLERATLLLVGDGPERARIEQLARDRKVTLVCTGTVAHDEIPAHLAAMDVGLVLASGEQRRSTTRR